MQETAGNMSIQTMVHMHNHAFYEAEQKVADFVIGPYRNTLISLPVAAAAAQIGVSEATIIRFCKKIGIGGYSDLKLALAKEAGQHEASSSRENLDVNIDRHVALDDLPQKIIYNTISGLQDTLTVVRTDMLCQAINAVKSARHIVLFGVANSAVVCEDLYCKLMRLGFLCSVYDDSHQQLTAAAHMKPGDVAIGISHSGQTKDTVNALRLAREHGATTICISNHVHSPLTDAADILLLTGAHESSFLSETMVSRISQMAIVDMLYVGLILSDYDLYLDSLEQVNAVLKDKAF